MRHIHENRPAQHLSTLPARDADRPVPVARRSRALRVGVTAGVTAALAVGLLASAGTGAENPSDSAAAARDADVVALAAGPGTLSTSAAASLQVSRTTSAASVKVVTSKAAAKKARILAKKRYKIRLKRLAKKQPRAAARKMMRNRGYSKAQRRCVIKLWNKESNWRWWADNPSSSAYGIPQALPGSKMASAGRDWRTNPVTQIKWGLKYIKDRHGSPCGAWRHSQTRGWY